MAAKKQTRTFVCSCFFENNVFISKYRMHVSYRNRTEFMDCFAKELRNKGCVTDEQFAEVISEVENEIARRRSLGEASLQRQEAIRSQYVPLNKEVYQLQESYLDPEFLKLVSYARSPHSNADSLLEQMQVLGAEVYTIPVFTHAFCRQLLDELDHIENSQCPKGRPNSMNNHGILLEEYGFSEGLINPLREIYLRPLTSLLFPAWGGACLDSHKAFTVTYEPHQDRDLSCHFDNAEVTLNVSLGYEGFTGGDLCFYGLKGSEQLTQAGKRLSHTKLVCKHRPGWGILHRGLHMHSAEPILSGKRCNLIIWMRASSVRNKHCPMCGEAPKLVERMGMDDGFRVREDSDGSGLDREERVVDVCRAL